jgi:hypothetical protein
LVAAFWTVRHAFFFSQYFLLKDLVFKTFSGFYASKKCYKANRSINQLERENMNQNRDMHDHWFSEGVITAVAFGGFLILVGLVFALTPDLPQKIVSFFDNLTSSAAPIGSNSNIVLPAPADPSAHQALYTAVLYFDIGFGVLQALILALRLFVHSKIRRIAETIGNIVFWFGAALVVNVFLLTGTLSGWFEYWAALVIVVGASFIARAFVYFAKR